MSAIAGTSLLWLSHASLTLNRLGGMEWELDVVCLCAVGACGMASEAHQGN